MANAMIPESATAVIMAVSPLLKMLQDKEGKNRL